jgi:hypothetical protein
VDSLQHFYTPYIRAHHKRASQGCRPKRAGASGKRRFPCPSLLVSLAGGYPRRRHRHGRHGSWVHGIPRRNRARHRKREQAAYQARPDFRGNHSPFRCKFEVSDGKARHPGKTQTCRLGQPFPRRSLTANTIALLRAIILLTRGPTAPKLRLWHKSIGELTAILTVFVAVLSVELHDGYSSAFTNSRLIAFVRR